MRVLMVAGASPATLFALVPLASALRNDGHDVLMASTEEMVPVAEKLGVPFAAVTDRSLASLLGTDRAGRPVPRPDGLDAETRFAGRWFGRLAAASIDGLAELAGVWHPDLVVGGTSAYAAGLLAARLDVPHVRVTWDALDATDTHPHADEELAPELAELGLDRLPPPDLVLDVCPPSLRSPVAPPATALRWTPGNLQRRVEPWMLAPGDRPRVCVTSGSRVAMTGSVEFLQWLAECVAGLGAEILVAAPEDAAPQLRAQLPGLRVGWLPLDVLAPTCDLVVHHGGGVTALTAMSRGVPQLVLPGLRVFGDSWQRLARSGAGIALPLGEQQLDGIAEACRELLGRDSHRTAAQGLAAEIADLPGPAAHVPRLVELASRRPTTVPSRGV